MARLPVPGSDSGSWGTVLNEFLSVSLTETGELKDGIITGDNIAEGTIAESQLTTDVQEKLNAAAGGATNLSATAAASTVTVASSTGDDAVLPAATGAAAGVLTASDKTKLDSIATGAQVNAVTSVAGRTGAVTLAKADVALGNVDNTSDANKPLSTAATTALAGKANTSHTHAIADVTNLQASLDAKAASSHTHTSSNVSDLTETVQDIINTTIVAGTNVTATYNDTAGTLTIAASGAGGGTTDHGALSGLTDDDHTQYLNNTRGDARYYTQTAVNTLMQNTDAVIRASGGVYPVRTSVTSNTSRRVRWVGPNAPTVGGSYAITGLDVWEQTT